MKLILNGKINRTYVQSLCMMFFHGEKFPENEENPNKSLLVNTVDTENGIECECILEALGKKAQSKAFVEFAEGEKYERTSKAAVGMAVYNAGTQLTGKVIPWGILTGIRPSKVAYEQICRHGEDKAKLILREGYFLSENKTNWAIQVTKNEGEILKLSDNNDCSLYISIPFCPSRCNYCSFISYATPKLFELIPHYIDKLVDEIKSTLKGIKKQGLKLLTVYIGGGTPTVLNESQLEAILKAVYENINVNELLEFTLEGGRPDTITDKKLSIAKKYGVDRISVNPQTLNDEVLKSKIKIFV